MTGSFMGRGNQYIHLVKVLYCKLPTIGKEVPTFKNRVWGRNSCPERWEIECVTTALPWPPSGIPGSF